MKKSELLLTPEGFLALEEELNDLKQNRRPDIIKSLKEARALGDLSENAEYDAARNEQAQVEGRIKELEYKLENAIVSDGKDKTVVSVGNTITVKYIEDQEEEIYKMVGSLEADPFDNKISNESPIGVAIIGHKVGEVITVSSPTGSYDIEILKIA